MVDKRAAQNSKLINKNYSEFEKSYKFVLPGYNLRQINKYVLGLKTNKKVKDFIKCRKENANFL